MKTRPKQKQILRSGWSRLERERSGPMKAIGPYNGNGRDDRQTNAAEFLRSETLRYTGKLPTLRDFCTLGCLPQPGREGWGSRIRKSGLDR